MFWKTEELYFPYEFSFLSLCPHHLFLIAGAFYYNPYSFGYKPIGSDLKLHQIYREPNDWVHKS